MAKGASDFSDLGAKPLGAADFADLQDAPANAPSAPHDLEHDKNIKRVLAGIAEFLMGKPNAIPDVATEALGLPSVASIPRGLARYPEPPGANDPSQVFNFIGKAAIPTAVGAMTGAALGPVGAGAGALRGAAMTAGAEAVAGVAGETAGQVAARAAGNKDALSAGEVAAQGALSGALGGAVRLGAEGAIAGIPKAKAAAKTVTDLAAKYGIDLTPAEIRASKALSGLEVFLEKTFLGAGAINARREASAEALRRAKDNLIAKAGTDKERQAVGLAFFDMIRQRAESFNNAVRTSYSRAFAKAPDEAINIDNFIKTGDKLAERQGISPFGADGAGAVGEKVSRFFKRPTDNATGFAKPVAVSPGAMVEIRTDLTQAIADYDQGIKLGIKTMSSRQAGAYKQLLAALEKDMDAYAASGKAGQEFIESYRRAKGLAKLNYETFNSPAVVGVLKRNPEAVESIIGRDSVTEIQNLKKAAGKKGFEQVRELWLTNLLRSEKNAAGKSLQNAISPDNITPDTMRELFADQPQALKELQEIAQIQSLVGSAERSTPSTGSSRVAANTLTQGFGATIGSLLGIPFGSAGVAAGSVAGSAAAVLAPGQAARIYLNPASRKIALEGLRAAPGSRAKAIAAARLAAFVGKAGASE